ncbi:G-protein coupled receptor 1 [Mactra antiquata]
MVFKQTVQINVKMGKADLIPPKSLKKDSASWVEIIPISSSDHHHRACANFDRQFKCTMEELVNSTVTNGDGTTCEQKPDNIHEQTKQKILIPLTILILVTNIVVLLFIIFNRRFHTPTYTFIASLGVADIFVGFVSIVTVATKANESDFNMCLARIGVTIASISASVWSLTCVAIDRYIAVTRALRYKVIMTKQKTIFGIMCSWFISMTIGALPLIGWNDGVTSYKSYCSFMYVLPDHYILFVFFISAIIPFTTMFVTYGVLFKSARFHIKQIQTIEKLQTDRRSNGVFGISARTLRSVKTFAAVLGCVFVTWLPFLITTLLQLIKFEKNCDLQEIIGTHLLVLGFSNSFLNPLIYALGTKDFRSKVNEVLHGKCYVQNAQVYPHDLERGVNRL